MEAHKSVGIVPESIKNSYKHHLKYFWSYRKCFNSLFKAFNVDSSCQSSSGNFSLLAS